MTLDELRNEWTKDATIDTNDLLTVAARCPNLHAKYLDELVFYKLRYTKIQNDMD